MLGCEFYLALTHSQYPCIEGRCAKLTPRKVDGQEFGTDCVRGVVSLWVENVNWGVWQYIQSSDCISSDNPTLCRSKVTYHDLLQPRGYIWDFFCFFFYKKYAH